MHTQTASNAIYDPTPATYDESFAINGLNQIASQGGQAFTYDTAGNLLTSPGQTYGYDFANRLTSVANTNGTTALTYDAASRLSTVGPSTGSKFGYSGQNMIEHLQVSNGGLRERYVHGPGTDEPIARYAHTTLSSYTWSYYAVDHRGSIIGQTQGSASLGTNSYDAYSRPDSGNTGLYQYTGQIWIADLKLYYYKARFYDPKIRRFLNADPIGYGDGMNMYGYVGGDPINFTDPSGLIKVTIPAPCPRGKRPGTGCAIRTDATTVIFGSIKTPESTLRRYLDGHLLPHQMMGAVVEEVKIYRRSFWRGVTILTRQPFKSRT